MRVRYHTGDQFLLIRVSGRYRQATSRKMLETLVERANSGADRILLDTARLTGRVPVVDRFELAEFLASKAPDSLRLAVVSPPELWQDRVFEPVAASRGVRIQAFAHQAEAESWLIGD